jgi:hypothetical protein
MKFDFDKKFVLANGLEDGGLTMAHFLSPILAHAKSISAAYQPKFWQWSIALATSGVLDLDASDTRYLISYIREHKELPVAIQQQYAEILEAKEAA